MHGAEAQRLMVCKEKDRNESEYRKSKVLFGGGATGMQRGVQGDRTDRLIPSDY